MAHDCEVHPLIKFITRLQYLEKMCKFSDNQNGFFISLTRLSDWGKLWLKRKDRR